MTATRNIICINFRFGGDKWNTIRTIYLWKLARRYI